MSFKGDDFICFKYLKEFDENSRNISRGPYLHVTHMDQKYKEIVFKTKHAPASVKKESLWEAKISHVLQQHCLFCSG